MKAGRRFRSKGNDSLDLLLDTICNAFGGIVLIAILIALLTRDTQERMEEQASSANRELIERQIASLQGDIKEAQIYLERQAPSVSVDPKLILQLGHLKGALETAKGKNNEAWIAWKDAASKAAGDDPDSGKALRDRVAITTKRSQLETANTSLKEKWDRLKMRLGTLQHEWAEIVNGKAEQLRLPKEQAERGGHIFILLKNGEIYPLFAAQDGELKPNEYSLEWERLGDSGFEVMPIPGKGVRPEAAGSSLGEFLDVLAREGKYAALDVDSKSVEAYRALRTELLRRRIPFGWNYDETAKQSFSPNGSVPPPL